MLPRDPRETLRLGLTHRVNSTLAAARAYLDLLKGLCLINWEELGKPNGAEFVRVLREKWDNDIRALKGTTAKATRKALAQGLELDALQKAHVRTVAQLRLVNRERDELKGLLHVSSPSMAAAWLEEKRKERALDDPNRLRAADCKSVGVTPHGGSTPPQRTTHDTVLIQAAGSVLAHGPGENTVVYMPGAVRSRIEAACITVVTAGHKMCQCGRYLIKRLIPTDIPQTHETHGD